MSDSNSPPPKGGWKALPTMEALMANPMLKPIAGRLTDPALWRFRHQSVARGAAVGAFWAFVIPFGQVFAAAAHCTFWRANIPVAAAVTMVTNPLTLGFWLWLAYHVGAWLTGESATATSLDITDMTGWLVQYGGTAALGMVVFAVGGAIASYVLVELVWRVRQWFKRRQRLALGVRRAKNSV